MLHPLPLKNNTILSAPVFHQFPSSILSSFLVFVLFILVPYDLSVSSQVAIIQELQFFCNKFGSSPILFSTSCTKYNAT